MKLLIKNGDTRIVRYGVGDFQITGDNNVELFYPQRLVDATDAPEEERIEGTLVAGICGQEFDDAAHRAEDLDIEQHEADDLQDYRVDPPRTH